MERTRAEQSVVLSQITLPGTIHQMNCCSATGTDTGKLFSWFAGLHVVRFRLLGFEKTQRQLIEGLKQVGVADSDVLEIGCGPGYLHQALLREGAARATGVDLAEGMLARARAEAQRNGLQQRTDYRLGDFVRIADAVPDSDVTILDKVVCCYPDWQALLEASLRKTRHVYGLTFPRDRTATRAGVRFMGWGLNLFGCCYQPYVHDPEKIEACILSHGFRKVYGLATTNWLTQVYER